MHRPSETRTPPSCPSCRPGCCIRLPKERPEVRYESSLLLPAVHRDLETYRPYGVVIAPRRGRGTAGRRELSPGDVVPDFGSHVDRHVFTERITARNAHDNRWIDGSAMTPPGCTETAYKAHASP